jgi:hypothetical protein
MARPDKDSGPAEIESNIVGPTGNERGEETMKAAIHATVVIVAVTLLSFSVARTVRAQDAVKVDPKHYKLEFENDQIRVVRIHVGPHEKTVMHDRPAGVAVFLTANYARFTLRDGKTEERSAKAGEVRWQPALKFSAENLSDKPLSLIYIEPKAK